MVYNGSDFFYGINTNEKTTFQIKEEDIEKIKRLKSYRSNQSGYYDVMLQWRFEDNSDVVKDEEELSRLFVTMQFISMTAFVKDDFIKSLPFDVEKYHIGLLRTLYLDFDRDYITMGFKRPFGNSHVLGDVRYEIKKAYPSYDGGEDDYRREESVLLEFVDFLEEFFKSGFEVPVYNFHFVERDLLVDDRNKNAQMIRDIFSTYWSHIDQGHWYLRSWLPDLSEIRNSKLEKILN
jgi:hypothetical protein